MRSVLLVVLVGCASPTAPPPAGSHYAYTIDHLHVPANSTQARAYGLDLNGDQTIDNELGATLATASGMGMDSTGATERAVADGMIALGVDLQTTAFDEASAVGFTTSATSGAALEGTVEDGTFTLGPGPLSIAISVVDSTLVVPLDLVDARVELIGVDDSGIAQGVIAGGVTAENLRDDLYPALTAGFTEVIHRDCDAACKCEQYSTGALLAEYFGCTFTADDLAANALTQSLFAADITLDDQKLLSFGVGFSATRRN